MTGPLTGRVMSVETRNISEPTVAPASIGATTLYVNDASTFEETGGVVTIGGMQLGYTATNLEDDSITLAAALTVALDEQELVELYPATPVKTALVSLDDSGDNLEVVVPHSLLDKLVDGTRDDETAEAVTLERRGAYEWLIADAPAKPLEQASLDYVEGEEGYGLTEAGVQVHDLQATGEVGSPVVSADQIVLGGQDLVEILAPIPRNTKYATRGDVAQINAGNTSGTTELRLFTFNAGPVVGGRVYEIGVRGMGNGTVVGDVFWCRLRYTTDGSEPTLSSPVMPGGAQVFPVLTGNLMPINMPTTFEPSADGELRVAVTLSRRTGTGVAYVYANNPDFRFTVYATDLGLASDSSTALQQTAKTDGSGSDNPPETTKVLTWQPLHTENFTGLASVSGSASNTDTGSADIGWDVQAFGPPQSGDRSSYSVFHFNYADIVSKLASASSIVSVQLKFNVRSRDVSTGLDLSVFAHKYTSYPWNMAQDAAGEIAAGRAVLGQGSRNDCAPGSTYTITLNTAVGTNLKSGTYKGIGVTAPNTSASGLGSIFANPYAGRPTLIITIKSPA